MSLQACLGRWLLSLTMFSVLSLFSWSAALVSTGTRRRMIRNHYRYWNYGDPRMISNKRNNVYYISSLHSIKKKKGNCDPESFHEQIIATPATTTTRQAFLSSVWFGATSTSAITTGMCHPPSTMAIDFKVTVGGGASVQDPLDAALPVGEGPRARVLSLPLRSLPVSGCWATSITLSKSLDDNNSGSDDDGDGFFTYLAVVDTGSPFLTAPEGALQQTNKLVTRNRRQNKLFSLQKSFQRRGNDETEAERSFEQYGTTVGGVQWRVAPYLTLIGNGKVDSVRDMMTDSTNSQNAKSICPGSSNIDGGDGYSNSNSNNIDIESLVIQDQTDVVLGVPSEEVIQETGGIFFGLMTVDAVRPTPLEQLGYDAFVMRFGNVPSKNEPAALVLWDGRKRDDTMITTNKDSLTGAIALIKESDPYSMKLFDLTPYGPDLHHYGVLCDRFECRWGGDGINTVIAFDCNAEKGMNICTASGSAGSSANNVTLSRPLIVVFDTGLSGCIFSDTLWEEIQQVCQQQSPSTTVRNNKNKEILTGSNTDEMAAPTGCTVWLPTLCNAFTAKTISKNSSSSPPGSFKLSSMSNYWRFQSFRLPWWYADGVSGDNDDVYSGKTRKDNFPHVVVLGSAFWRNPNVRELAIDTVSQRAKITTIEQQ